jgi:NurA-like 5'-3' nuclease
MIIEGLQESLAGYRLELDDLPSTVANRREAMEKEREIYIAELKKKQAMIDKASEMLEMGVYTVEKYLERENILRNEINALQANLDALSDTSELEEIEKLENAVPILEKCLDEYWTLNPAEKNEILKSFVNKILYSKSIKNNSHHKNLDDANVEIFLKI